MNDTYAHAHAHTHAHAHAHTRAYSETCKFLREHVREVKSDVVKHVGGLKDFTATTVKEYFWRVDVDWQVIVYKGTDLAHG